MHALAQWAVAIAILAAIPLLVRVGRRNARGRAGGVALMLGLAFGHLFDPARAEATESIRKRGEQPEDAEAAAGGPGESGNLPKHLSE